MPKKILIVDDDRRLCQELASCLEENGYPIECAFDGGQGEELLRQNQYDIILLDVKMPNSNGLDVLRKLKEIRPETAVILITGRPFIEQFIEEENASSLVAGFLKKPFQMEKLIEKIETQ